MEVLRRRWEGTGRFSSLALAGRMAVLAVLAACAGTGVGIQLAHPIASRGTWGMLSYFTVQSNILVAALALVEAALLARGKKPGRRFALVRGAVLLAILCTGAVFSLFLARIYKPQGIMVLANGLTHYASPILAFGYWIAFAEKGLLKPADALAWLAYPLLYAVWSLAYGASTGFYPYWFLDPRARSAGGIGSAWGVLAFAVATAAAFWALGLALALADHRLARSRGDVGV